MGDWHAFSRRAMQQGHSLSEASAMWRRTHQALHGNPSSPESIFHHRRRKHVGGLLSRGVSFREAIRSNPELPPVSESESARHTSHHRWLLVGGLVLGFLYLRNQQWSQPITVVTDGRGNSVGAYAQYPIPDGFRVGN